LEALVGQLAMAVQIKCEARLDVALNSLPLDWIRYLQLVWTLLTLSMMIRIYFYFAVDKSTALERG
jgi:uncharacterized protein involved in cysteine biosynthesis